jgi:hypothetical protein
MAVSSVGLRLKCDCSAKAQKQLYSKLQTSFPVREDALIAKRRNCQTKEEEQDKIWSRVPKGVPIPRLTGRLTVGRKKNSNSVLSSERAAYMKNKESNCHSNKCNIWSPAPKGARHQDEVADWPSVVMWLRLRCWCPEILTNSIYWAQLNRLHLKT